MKAFGENITQTRTYMATKKISSGLINGKASSSLDIWYPSNKLGIKY